MLSLPLTTDLITATRREERSTVHRLLRRHWWHLFGVPRPQVDATDSSGNSALHYAVLNDDSYSVRELLDAGARTDLLNQQEGTPLHIALATGSAALVDIIMAADNGRSKDLAAPSDGATPLHLAARRGLRSFVRRLLQLGADANARDAQGATALDVAFASDADSALLAALLHAGATLNIDIPEQTECRLLYRAILDDYPDVVQLMLQRGTDPSRIIPNEGLPPLNVALIYRRPAIAVLLIHAHVDLGPDKTRHTPLHLACRHGYVDIVRRLLLFEADIKAQDARGLTPAQVAVESGRLEVLRTLLAERAEPAGLLTLAAANGHLDIVRLLLLGDVPVDVNETLGGGRSPLRCALQNGHADVAHFLRSHGASSHEHSTGNEA